MDRPQTIMTSAGMGENEPKAYEGGSRASRLTAVICAEIVRRMRGLSSSSPSVPANAKTTAMLMCSNS